MKNYQYLKSGMLEAHLLGLFKDQEQNEVVQLLERDSEVLDQLGEIEVEMEEYFMNNAVPPPPGIREKIELRISQTDLRKWGQPEPEPQAYTRQSAADTGSKEQQYVHVDVDETYLRVHKHWKTAFIAVFVLGKVFLITGLYFYFKADSLQQEVARLKAEVKIQQTAPLRR